ncbi:MAG: NHL domain-containing thioredoxin family protein [Actinomycetales bacterium]|nr:NHL domain-containing thioredoxin family protein [Actinomycetales bacterium]
MAARVRAPELVGRQGWLNTGGRALTIGELRGKFVILDFWTFCCINCLHVLDELRPIEQEFADCLVTIGVHSPKFVHEADHAALIAAVERYEVHHPVLDDPDLATWQAYAVRAWPTLVITDPEGYIVGQFSGEGHGHAIRALLTQLVAEHEAKGSLHRGDGPYVPPPAADTVLRFPSKAVRCDDGTFVVADAKNHRLAVMDPSGTTLIRSIGMGERGLRDGGPSEARFSEPNGIAVLPAEVSARCGYDLVVADTVNHCLRGVDLDSGAVRTVAGTGAQWMQGDPLPVGADAVTPLSSPWDVAWSPTHERVIVAMAGIHQLWWFDPVTREVGVFAGTTNEGLVDGELDKAWFAQTSGLAVDDEGTIWLADSETSSLRRVRNGVVTTDIGRGLFDFGMVDGDAADALLQHPLGVAVLPDGSIALADTYNGAVRRYEPATKQVTTLVTGLVEPSGIVVVPDDARGAVLLVVESAAHRLTFVPLPEQATRVDARAYRTQRPQLQVRAGAAVVRVPFVAPAGQKLDDRYGPSTHLVVSSTPAHLLASGAGAGEDLQREVVFADPSVTGVTEGVLHVAARAASCDDPDAPGAAEFPACHVHQQDWGVPVRLMSDGSGATEVVLPLAGL